MSNALLRGTGQERANRAIWLEGEKPGKYRIARHSPNASADKVVTMRRAKQDASLGIPATTIRRRQLFCIVPCGVRAMPNFGYERLTCTHPDTDVQFADITFPLADVALCADICHPSYPFRLPVGSGSAYCHFVPFEQVY